MAEARFLQIHTLTPYAATLMNRDDIGRAKRMSFGGTERIRISSQARKRHWRQAVDEWSLDQLDGHLAVRSRHVFDWTIARQLQEDGIPDDVILAVLQAFKASLFRTSEKSKAAGETKAGKGGKGIKEGLESLRTEQVVVIGRPEIDFITAAARDIAAGKSDAKAVAAAAADYLGNSDRRDNLRAIVRGSGLDVALFGRMVTSDILARVDAAVHVSHAFTVHAEESEPDYFTAVDDLAQEAGEPGSGHINVTELTSGLFYGYVVIDLQELVDNMSGDTVLAARAVEHLVHLIATVSPGAKRGSTAPYGYAEILLVEAGARQPRSLANAFLRPVSKRGDLRANTTRDLTDYLNRFDTMYGTREERKLASVFDAPDLPADRAKGIDEIATWAAGHIREATT